MRSFCNSAQEPTLLRLASRALGFKFILCIAFVGWTAVFYKFLPHFGHATELTTSGGVWYDNNKIRDVLIVPFVVTLQVALIAIYVQRSDAPSPSVSQTWAWAVVAFVGATSFLAPYWGELAVLTTLGLTVLLLRYREERDWPRLFGYVVLFGSTFSCVANWMAEADTLYGFLGGSLLATAILLQFPAAWGWLVATSGTVVVIVYLLSLPGHWMPTLGDRSVYPNLAFLALALMAAIATYRQLEASRDHQTPQPSPLLLALAMGAMVAWRPPAAGLPIDDYHFGEFLTAAQALEQGRKFFVDFYPPHGFSDAVGGLGAMLQTEQNATTIQSGANLLLSFAHILMLWVLFFLLGPVTGTVLALALPGTANIVALLLLLASIAWCGLMRSPVAAGLLSVTLSIAAIFYIAGLGIVAAVVGYIAAAILQATRGTKHASIFFAASLFTAIAWAVSLFEQVRGQLLFLLTSAQTNLVIYGNNHIRQNIDSGILNFLARFLFTLSPAIFFALLWTSRLKTPTRGRLLWILCAALPIITLVILFANYAMARLDATAPRAAIASLVAIPFVCVWFRLIQLQMGTGNRNDDSLQLSTISLVSLLVISIGDGRALAARTLPFSLPAQLKSISDTYPRLGRGRSDSGHVARFLSAASVVEHVLHKGETFVDLTNRSSYYYFLDRLPSAPIPSAYNSAPDNFQKLFVDAVVADKPPLALVSVDSIFHDGVNLPLRAYSIYKMLIEDYRPFLANGNLFAIRRDKDSRISKLTEQPAELSPLPLTDANWTKGIANEKNSKNWTLLLPSDWLNLEVGQELHFSDGVSRKIQAISGNQVLTTPGIDVSLAGTIRLLYDAPLSDEQLWSYAFGNRNFNRLPSAWGRSLEKLNKAISGPTLPLIATGVHQLQTMEPDATKLKATGNDPQRIYAPQSTFSPKETGLLALDITCAGSNRRPKVQIFWRSRSEAYSEVQSVSFEASFPFNLVPLDVVPLWSLKPEVSEIRIDISNPNECPISTIRDVQLLSRAEPK